MRTHSPTGYKTPQKLEPLAPFSHEPLLFFVLKVSKVWFEGTIEVLDLYDFSIHKSQNPHFPVLRTNRPVKASLLKHNFGSPKLVRSSPARGHGAMAVDLDVVGCC